MKIRNKLALMAILLSILPLSFSILFIIPTTQESQTNELLSHLSSIANIQKSRAEELIDNYYELSYFGQYQLSTYISAYLYNSSIDVHALAYLSIIGIQESNDHIERLELANASGTVLASTNITRLGYNLSGQEIFTRALLIPVIDDFYLNENNSLRLHLGGRIIINETACAVVVIDYNPSDLVELFQDYTGLGSTGEALFAKRDAHGDALFVNPLRHMPQSSLNRTLSKDDLSAPITQALLGVEATFIGATDYRGYSVLAVTRYIPIVDWGIVVKMDIAEAYASIYQIFNTTLLLSIVSSLTILVIGFVVSISITKPIATLSEAATRISEGDTSHRANITSGDEMERLANSVNKMADILVNANIILEEQVKQRTKELSWSNKSLEQFASVISHDLQEPLRMIVAYLQLIEDRYKDLIDADIHAFIGFVVDGAKRMRDMIIGLLEFSRAGRLPLLEEEVDCNDVVVEVLSNLRVAIKESGGNVEIGHLPSIMTDRGGIIMLFQNLISNAIKFRSETPPKIVLGAIEGIDMWQFSVADNGFGIPAEHFARIFDVFQKLHPRSEYSGTGIGLSICKRVIERLGGSIWVESVPNAGSTFYFTIPKGGLIE